MEGRGQQWGHHSERGHPSSSFPGEGTWEYAYDPDPQSGLDGSQHDMGEEISGLLRPPAIPQQYLNPSYQADIAYDSGTYVGSQAAAFPYLIEEPTFPQATGVAPPGYGRREPDRLNNVYRKQQRLLRETNTNTSLGRVVEGADSLIEMSRLVLGNVESLGLTKDNEDLHKVRLEFWKEFNHSWLAFLTRQLQDSRTRRESGQPLSGGQTVLSKDRVKALGDELKSLNDDLQHTGLIDYEMGVWEKEISDVLIQCWNIWADEELS